MSASYKVDCVEGGIRNLKDLISIICEVRFELAAGEDDTRLDSLLWIARDVAEGLVECHDQEVRERAERRAA